MSETVGERIERYKTKKEIVETAKKGIRKERMEKIKKGLQKTESIRQRMVKSFAGTGKTKGLAKLAKKKVKSRRILKHIPLSVTIPADAGRAPYIPTFMRETVEQEKRSLFFS